MSNKSSSDNFFQPIISVFGLGVSLITAILPLFSKEMLTVLFINKSLAQPASFLAFMIGIAIIWQITEFQPYIHINLGKSKNRGNNYNQYWKTIGPNGIVWTLVLFDILFCFSFLYLGNKFIDPVSNYIFGVLQAIVYLLFFLFLISIFAILFAQIKQRFNWQKDRDNFPVTIFETLEKNRLVKPGIEIYENKSVNTQELQQMGINMIGIFKRIKIRTISQKDEIIEFIISNDGKEIIQVLKKEEQK